MSDKLYAEIQVRVAVWPKPADMPEMQSRSAVCTSRPLCSSIRDHVQQGG